MSNQFGRWSFDGRPSDALYVEKARELLAPYGSDSCVSFSRGGAHILYCAFHTTKESRNERQFSRLDSGAILTWDGRLDNRADLIRLIDKSISSNSTALDIVKAAFEKRGTDCLAFMIGDWALSTWNPVERCLVLAKDPLGLRHLYYSLEPTRVTWNTTLDPLVILAERAFALDYEYLAGWLGMFSATHLTPYAGISSVPPGCFVSIKPGGQTLTKYWEFDPAKRVHCATDAEYEERFRSLFAQSLRRRIRSDTPVLAELSGGVDSSSIVCMADALIAQGATETPRLDTVSYYDDSEPNWNERPYFTQVEQMRGRTGWHIRVNSRAAFCAPSSYSSFAATPGAGNLESEAAKSFATCRMAHGNRVVLSGFAGDEVAGGVPTPIPELADLLAGFQYLRLAKQLKAWALSKKRPWVHLLSETVGSFLPLVAFPFSERKQVIPWLAPDFASHNQAALAGYESSFKLFGAPPSFQANLSVLQMLRRQLSCSCTFSQPPFEIRYPYLDRDLLEFLFAIPRSQVVRPGQRRSLVRRALSELVPDAILNRRQKAFVVRGPMAAIATDYPDLINRAQRMIATSLGIIDPKILCEALHKGRLGQEVPVVPLMRTFALENWLVTLANRNVQLPVSPAVCGASMRTANQRSTKVQSGRVGCKSN